MALHPSSVPLRVPLPAPPESSLPEVLDPESDRARAASPTVARLLTTAVTDPYFESAAASALVAELFDFAAAWERGGENHGSVKKGEVAFDYVPASVAASVSVSVPPSGPVSPSARQSSSASCTSSSAPTTDSSHVQFSGWPQRGAGAGAST
ncbi:unnamed protein product [Closterium sp. NIES-54]